MISSGKWFERKFSFELKLDDYPLIIERLRGTPVRIEHRIKGLSPGQLTRRPHDSWSIQENIGHLGDLEPLWVARLDDLLSGARELTPADLSNTKTHAADHNSKSVQEILDSFRIDREDLVSRLEQLSKENVLVSSTHPRLNKPMRTLDLVYFAAEHDDHHLARITGLLLEVQT